MNPQIISATSTFTSRSIGDLNDAFAYSLQNTFDVIGSFLPQLVYSLLLFFFFVAVGVLLSRAVQYLFEKLFLEKVLESFGVHDMVCRSGMPCNVGKFVGETIKWIVIIIAASACFEILGLMEVDQFITGLVTSYIPKVIIAALVMIIASLVGKFMQRLVAGSAKAAHIPAAHILGSLTKWSVWIFSAIIALINLDITLSFIETVSLWFVIAVSIGAGIALGLGGKDIAKGVVEHIAEDMKGNKYDD